MEKEQPKKKSTLDKVKEIYESLNQEVKVEQQITSTLQAAGRTEPDYMKAQSREKYSYHIARAIAFTSVIKIIEPLFNDLIQEQKELDKLKKQEKKDA